MNLTNKCLAGAAPLALLLLVLAQASLRAAIPSQGTVYWSNFSHGTIESASFDGTNRQVVVSGLMNPRGVDFDPQSNLLYWTDMNAHKIQRSNADGSNRIDITSFGITSVPNDIVVDRVHSQLYWTLDGFTAGAVQRSDLSGGGIQTLVTTGSDELAELELDLPDGKMFWTEFTSGLICESNLDGSGFQTLVSGLKDPRGLALDLSHGKMYWTELGDGSGARIQRANLDGSNQQLLLQGNTLNEPGGISVDSAAGFLYWVEPDAVRRSTVDGFGLTTVISSVNASYAGDLVLQFPVPEPSVIALLAIGVIGSASRHRKPTSRNRA